MGAAISIFVLMTVSIFVVRIAAVAMRLTGLDDASARFQALSAFSGTGFTTRESEMIVNYPVRRRITSGLMIIGNLGLVGVFATLVASIVQTDGDVSAVMTQLGWLLAGIALLWFLILNKTADRIMCGLISRVLNATTQLGRRKYHRVLQIGDGLSVCEHPFQSSIDFDGLESIGLTPIAVRDNEGNIYQTHGDASHEVRGGWLIAYGDDSAHEALAKRA